MTTKSSRWPVEHDELFGVLFRSVAHALSCEEWLKTHGVEICSECKRAFVFMRTTKRPKVCSGQCVKMKRSRQGKKRYKDRLIKEAGYG